MASTSDLCRRRCWGYYSTGISTGLEGIPALGRPNWHHYLKPRRAFSPGTSIGVSIETESDIGYQLSLRAEAVAARAWAPKGRGIAVQDSCS